MLRPPESNADFAARSDHGPDESPTSHGVQSTRLSQHTLLGPRFLVSWPSPRTLVCATSAILHPLKTSRNNDHAVLNTSQSNARVESAFPEAPHIRSAFARDQRCCLTTLGTMTQTCGTNLHSSSLGPLLLVNLPPNLGSMPLQCGRLCPHLARKSLCNIISFLQKGEIGWAPPEGLMKRCRT